VNCPLSGDGSRFVRMETNSLRVFDTASGRAVSPVISLAQSLKAAAFSQDGAHILTISTNAVGTDSQQCVAEVLNGVSGHRVGPPLLLPVTADGYVLSTNGQRLLVYEGKLVRVWNTVTGVLLSEKLHEEKIVSAVFSPSADRAATWGGTVVRVWTVSTGQDLFPPLHHQFLVKHVEFSPDGGRIITCGAEGSFDKCPAQVWDALTGKAAGPPLKHGDGIVHAAFSRDGRWIVTSSEDSTSAVWDARTGVRLTPPLRHGNTVMAAAFSTDNRWVATASHDDTARIWSAETGDPLTPALRHRGHVSCANFLLDNRHVVTCDGLGGFSTWSLEVEDKSAEDIVALARLLSGGGVTDPGLQISLKQEPMINIWRRLRARYPADFETTPTQVEAWHKFEADEAVDLRQWEAALFHLEQLRVFRPGDTALLERLARIKKRAAEAN
jgi:WD40 repeat protein